MDALTTEHCQPCEGGIDPLDSRRIARLLPQVPGWSLADDGRSIARQFDFDGFLRTMNFINAMAWMTQRQGHHPDFTAGPYHCRVSYTTHAIGGLSENDFICAARLNRIAKEAP